MASLEYRYLNERPTYTGRQLRALWAYEKYDVLGDSAVAFVGPCDVEPKYMRDVEDLKAGAAIRSREMLHFIVEHFDCGLETLVLRQHLFMAIMAEQLNRHLEGMEITRRGSDLFRGDRKLTVSVAAPSPVSGLIHAGINVVSAGTPVPTHGLQDFSIETRAFGLDMLKAYAAELETARAARCKVRPCP
jgi:hypothetical protein